MICKRVSILAVMSCVAAMDTVGAQGRTDLLRDPRAGDALRAEVTATPDGEKAQVLRTWLSYVASKNGRFDCAPSEFWLAGEQGNWTTSSGITGPVCYDLASQNIGGSQKPEVLRVDAVAGAPRPTYRITTRFVYERTSTTSNDLKDALVVVYAVRDGSAWKLSSALMQETRSWQRETVGPFTYIISPRQEFSRRRAEEAAAFADSLARALGVPPIESIKYFLFRDADDLFHTTGYYPDTTYAGSMGRALPGMILSGDRVFRENHGHEIAHYVIVPLSGRNLHIAASEGVPTWLGGSRERRYAEGLEVLRKFLVDTPSATLDTVIARNDHPMHNYGAALVAAMVHEYGGVDAIRKLMNSGPSLDQFKAGVAAIAGRSWADFADEWRRRAMR